MGDQHASFQRAVADDCLEFLARQPSPLDPGEHCFGYEHQTRLRAICAIRAVHAQADVRALVDDYWAHPGARDRLAAEALDGAEAGGPDDAGRFVFSETRRDHFDSWLRAQPANAVATDYGVACLDGAEPLDGPAGAVYHALPASRPSSIGMLMFYGFSPASGRAVLQQLPIRLLAATAEWCAAHGTPPATRTDWTTQRMTDACRAVRQCGDFEPAALRMFLLHEAGHLPETLHASDPLHDVARLCVAPPAQLVSAAFPDAERRQTWPRLKERSSLEGALYMLGDLLANVRALAFAPVDPASWAFMQAFNWRFVPPAGPLRIPRGNLALLMDEEPDRARRRGVDGIERIALAHRHPQVSSSDVLMQFESDLWHALSHQGR